MTESVSRAVAIANGTQAEDPGASALEIVGAENDYNARGRGNTTARRVWRGGDWQWVSAPASRGRFLASDRRDVKYGPVFEGEIVAEYILGGPRKPEYWYLVVADECPLVPVEATQRRDGQWAVSLAEGQTVVVSNPYWR